MGVERERVSQFQSEETEDPRSENERAQSDPSLRGLHLPAAGRHEMRVSFGVVETRGSKDPAIHARGMRTAGEGESQGMDRGVKIA